MPLHRSLCATLAAAAAGALLCAGCAPRAAPACLRYVACQQGYDAAAHHVAKDTSAYVEGGRCWADGATAARCAQECEEALQALAAAARAGGIDAPACR